MDREELKFILQAVADDLERGFKAAERAVDDLGQSYDKLSEAEGRMNQANEDLRKRMEGLQQTLRTTNLEAGKMPAGIRQIANAFKAAASGAGVFAVAVLGIQAIAGIITKIKEASEKAKQELAALNAEAKKLAEQSGGMAFLVGRYEDLANNTARSAEETAEMARISRDLVGTYGMRANAIDEEGKGLLTNLKYMKEQAELSERMARITMQEAEDKNARGLKRSIKEMVAASEDIDRVIGRIGELQVALAEPLESMSPWAATIRNNMAQELEDLERMLAAYEKSIATGSLAVWDAAEQSMQLALYKMGPMAEAIPIEIQDRITKKMRELAATGGFFNSAMIVKELEDWLASGEKVAGEGVKSMEELEAQARKTATAIKGHISSVISLNNELQDLADLQAAIDVIREGDEASEDLALALDYVAKAYNTTADQVEDNLDIYEHDIKIRETLLELNILLAMQEAETAKIGIINMAKLGEVTAEESARMVGALDDVLVKLRDIAGTDIGKAAMEDGASFPSWKRTAVTRTARAPARSTAQAYKNTALEAELALIERKRKLDQMTTAEEILLLERAAKTLAKTAKEREDIYDKVYNLKKAQGLAVVEHQRAMDQLTLEEEIKHQEKLTNSYKKGTEARLDAERKLYALKKQEAARAYELDVYFGRLTLEQQRERTRAMIQDYKAGTDARIELERRLYDIQQEIRNRDTEALDRLAQGVIAALQNRYTVHRDEELAALQSSMKAWGDWADAQVKAIDTQIRALDDLTRQEDRADEETRRKRKIAALEQQLLYETDGYNRKKLEEQLAREKEDLAKWQTRNEREDQKQSLRDQADHVRDRAQAEQASLQAQMEAVNRFYDERLKAQNLAAEAEYALTEGSQDNIVSLIASYAPEYDILGQTLGESIYEGFISKAGAIADFIAQINADLQASQAQAAQLATNAAVQFWQSKDNPVVTPSTAPSSNKTPGGNTVNITLKEAPATPAELAREMERAIDRMSRT